jgi:hypothetical protein
MFIMISCNLDEAKCSNQKVESGDSKGGPEMLEEKCIATAYLYDRKEPDPHTHTLNNVSCSKMKCNQ